MEENLKCETAVYWKGSQCGRNACIHVVAVPPPACCGVSTGPTRSRWLAACGVGWGCLPQQTCGDQGSAETPTLRDQAPLSRLLGLPAAGPRLPAGSVHTSQLRFAPHSNLPLAISFSLQKYHYCFMFLLGYQVYKDHFCSFPQQPGEESVIAQSGNEGLVKGQCVTPHRGVGTWPRCFWMAVRL